MFQSLLLLIQARTTTVTLRCKKEREREEKNVVPLKREGTPSGCEKAAQDWSIFETFRPRFAMSGSKGQEEQKREGEKTIEKSFSTLSYLPPETKQKSRAERKRTRSCTELGLH
jgi:hypothetical protein